MFETTGFSTVSTNALFCLILSFSFSRVPHLRKIGERDGMEIQYLRNGLCM